MHLTQVLCVSDSASGAGRSRDSLAPRFQQKCGFPRLSAETQGGVSGLAENICVGGGFQSAVSGSATSVSLVRNEDSQAPPLTYGSDTGAGPGGGAGSPSYPEASDGSVSAECLSKALSASGLTGLGKVPALLAISQSLFMGEGEAHSTPPTPPAPQLRGRG